MLDKLANIFRIPDLRKRILFTLGMLFVYRLGGHLPTPGIDTAKLESFFTQGSTSGSLLGFVDLFSGGQLRRMTIFALGIMPYITASIILQLLTVVYEPLAKLQKEGELGRKKITQWTRYITVILSAVQSLRYCDRTRKRWLRTESRLGFPPDDDADPDHGQRVHHVARRTDHRARRGQRNVAADLCRHRRWPAAWRCRTDRQGQERFLGRHYVPFMVGLIVFMVAVVAFIVYVERSERRIPVQYAKRVVGRKVMGGQSTHLPLRVNAGGVMPVIFASSILTLPQTIGYGLRNNRYFGDLFRCAPMGRTALHGALRRRHHLLRVFLCFDRV